MPLRIYAFAKELGLDNKQLLDICENAGVEGKGSALASLDDVEIETIKNYLKRQEKSSSPSSSGGTATPPPMRPPSVRGIRKITEISAPKAGRVDAESGSNAISDDSGKIDTSRDSQVSSGATEPSAAVPSSTDGAVDSAVASSSLEEKPDTSLASDASQADSKPPVKSRVNALLDRLRGKSDTVGEDAGSPAKELRSESPASAKATPQVAETPTALHSAEAPTIGQQTATSLGEDDKGSAPGVPAPAKPVGPLARANRGMPTPKRPIEIKRNPSMLDLDKVARQGSEPPRKAKTTKPKKSAVNINLAAMPEVKQPSLKKREAEEKVQKPDIALPQEAIAQARVGAAPLESFTKSNKSKLKKKGRGKDDVPEEAAEAPGSAKRPRRDRRDGAEEERPLGLRPQRPGLAGRRGGFSRRGESGRMFSRRSGVSTAAPRKDKVVLELPCTVREFSEATGVAAVKVILEVQSLGAEGVRSINSMIDDDLVELLVMQMGLEVDIRGAESLEESIMAEVTQDDDPDSLKPRAPIVTFLGHVDHGKTSLLDALIGIDVVSGEAGGITQHIRAYEIHKGDRKIAFVDTPGHEAFTEMRARGANVTDIAVLVVAADDGIMPQTEEAISHIRAAGVPIIVALNKIDLPGVTPDKAMQDLAAHDLLPSEWGGETEVIKTSAITRQGLDELMEIILFTAEINEYKANPDRAAFGTCLEAEQQADRGVVTKLIVQGGTLKVGDNIVCGSAFGRVKAIHDTLRPARRMDEAGPSTPVNVTGFDVAPGAGDKFYVVDDIGKARELAEERRHQGTVQRVGGRTTRTSLQDFQSLLDTGDLSGTAGEVVTLNLIIRADVRGSIEAIQKELGKISHPEVEIRVIQALPGGVTVADVRLADASNAVIVGFNVVADETARNLAEELSVEVRRYDVIYKITDDLKATLEGRLKPEEQIVEVGMAMILRVFGVSKVGNIAGCRVMRGSIERDCRMRIIRDSRVIGDYLIESLKREKDDAKEVQRGMECGIRLAGFNDIKEGDTLEAYKIKEVARTL